MYVVIGGPPDGKTVCFLSCFVNAILIAKRLDVPFVFVVDAACTNMFHLVVISVLCRDAADKSHALCCGLLKNRTAALFMRFFTFPFKRVPMIRTFSSDRHSAQTAQSQKSLERL